jgi:FAD/FMN-containing dehydrogenase
MTDIRATLRARLDAAVGSAQVLTAESDVLPYVTDWRGRFHGRALAVVRPGSTDEVAGVVRACADLRVPIVAQGGNTGQCGGATPDAEGNAIVLSLARMNRVRAVDPDNATLTAESGVPLAAVQQAAADNGLLFPLSLAAEGSCTIGGNLSTNAGGTAVLRFGNARELVLGIEVVLADGRIWNGLRGLRKDNTGVSNGTCRRRRDARRRDGGRTDTLPANASRRSPAPDVASTVRLLRDLRATLGDRITGFELMSALSIAVSRKHHAVPDPCPGYPWYARSGRRQRDRFPDRAARAGAWRRRASGRCARRDDHNRGARALWALRKTSPRRREGPNIKHDFAARLRDPALPRRARDALNAALPGVQFVVGHSARQPPHNLAAPEGANSATFMANAPLANRIVHDLVAAHGGSISAEHGIGQLKRDELARYKSRTELDLMRTVKAALDPAGIFNPGKVL